IGAYYYLEVRKLLQERSDAEITREDYIELVRRIEREFLAGVQRNLRVRVLAEWTTGLKTIFKRNYSHTERLGELTSANCSRGSPMAGTMIRAGLTD
ncbi:MAG: hypothetical protein H0T45_01890, partial [Pyrinomonadaceae bacterium]|nr:hypothetical protein [Pyrinomonadaceae bacterium]